MYHPALEKWESNLKAVVDELDVLLEDKFGSQYILHPARPVRGTTSNKSHDGLFDIVSSFTPGKGSQYGKGYIVDVHMSTLEHIPKKIQNRIYNISINFLREKLPEFFPGVKLEVHQDGSVIKIHGDLSLGEV